MQRFDTVSAADPVSRQAVEDAYTAFRHCYERQYNQVLERVVRDFWARQLIFPSKETMNELVGQMSSRERLDVVPSDGQDYDYNGQAIESFLDSVEMHGPRQAEQALDRWVEEAQDLISGPSGPGEDTATGPALGESDGAVNLSISRTHTTDIDPELRSITVSGIVQ